MGTARSRAPGETPRAPRPASRRPGSRRPPVLRDWRAGVGLLAVVVAIVLAVVVLGGGSGGDDAAADRAATLAPADTLAWVHVSTDGDRDAVSQALTLAGRAGLDGTLNGLVGGLLGDANGQPVDFRRDVRPWLGDEAALALTRSGGRAGTAGSLLVLAVADEDGARQFLARTGGPARRGQWRGRELTSYRNGTVAAFTDGFLLVGPLATVRAALDIAAGARGASALADDPAYRRASAGQPDDRALDAYATAAGVQLALAPQSGALGLLGAFLTQPGLRAVSLALSAGDTSVRVRVRSDLDPRGRSAPGTFTPTLTSTLPRDTVGYLGFPGLVKAAPLLLSVGGIGGGSVTETVRLIDQAGRTLREQGVDFARDLLPLLGGEVAIAAVPVDGNPALVLVAKVADAAATTAALRRLEPALAKLFAAADGAAPSFGDAQAGGIAVRRLDAGGGVELDYALQDGVLALSAGAAPLAAVLRPKGSISENPDYKAVIPDSQSELTSIVFFDFSQLLTFFEPLGLGGDLREIRAVGLTSTGGKAQSTAELTFEIP